MKKNYLSPVIDIVEINAVDIITASGTGLSDNSLDPSVWSDFYDFDEPINRIGTDSFKWD
jgi:hypothetical protein